MARIAALVVVLICLLVACSDGGGSSPDTSPADTASPADTDDSASVAPTPYDPAANVVIDDLRFIEVEGERFFALGLHASPGLTYDGVTGPGECDKDAGIGYLDIIAVIRATLEEHQPTSDDTLEQILAADAWARRAAARHVAEKLPAIS